MEPLLHPTGIVMAVAVATAYFAIATMIVPRIRLENSSPTFVRLFRGGAVLFFIGCGLTHMHIATHAAFEGERFETHEAGFHVMQVFGGWLFVFAALRLVDIRVQRRTRPDPGVVELARLALRDELTGAYNRRHLEEALESELGRSSRSGQPFSLLVLDLDNFKQVNDAGGHPAGDAVLRIVAGALGHAIRPSDTLSRVGGDEFAILLPETGQLQALVVAERARDAVRSRLAREGERVTATIGAANWPDDAGTAEELWERADQALYWAKRSGKNLCAAASEVVLSGQAGQTPESAAPLYPLIDALDAEPLHTRDHSQNVAAYASAVGAALGLPKARLFRLRRAAYFHDIGKLPVRREVLATSGPLSDEEWREVREHPRMGAAMLSHAGLELEAEWVRQHHERFDGDGYPRGLSGSDISLEARIIFVADAFEAMTAKRPYQQPRTSEEALAELRRNAGGQFDPRIVEVFTELAECGALESVSVPA